MGALAEPLLLKGFFDEGSLVLEKADSRFLELINDMLHHSRFNIASEGLQRLAEAATATVANLQTDGSSAASVLFAPTSDRDSSLLVSPVVLSESVLRDLAATGQSALKIVLPVGQVTEGDLSRTTVQDVMNTVSDISVPIETSATRDTVKRTIESIPRDVLSVRSFIVDALRDTTAPVATLERRVGGALRAALPEAIPVHFGPFVSLGLAD